MPKLKNEEHLDCSSVLSMVPSGASARPETETTNAQQDIAAMDALAKLLASADRTEAVAIQHQICSIGDWIRDQRNEAKLTQEQIAQIAGVSRATVANVEAGIQPDGPRVGTIMKLLWACGKRLEWHSIDLPPEQLAIRRVRIASINRRNGSQSRLGKKLNDNVALIFKSEKGRNNVRNRNIRISSTRGNSNASPHKKQTF